jgi:hypothetical protein
MASHMRFPRLLGALALALAAASSASGGVRAVLHAPAEGEVLRGGTRATVAWAAEQLPPFVEEWEAFLSVDGGRYYAYRITPHLDVRQRRFTFDVPNVASDDARILIRAGDERREIELELSRSFVIEEDHARARTATPLAVDEDKRGEPARAGDRGVIEWIDGDRDGGHLTPRSALQREVVLREARGVETKAQSAEELPVRSLARRRGGSVHLLASDAAAPARIAPRHRSGRDVLLSYRRLNL